ncbi:mannose-6-phosphate receptor binding domain-containing protein [Lineolata rhizophorae]|uniref:Mannose-6-phosphate receptor binding domain-containing protein n=1 Tax=Lineolata rhizophorae TaxID=578093 RepID=A0A6A6NZE5_9PEZI|nr:mannose-6-phosphate receptor binding domain-containing protein [Lineolata rhizophorae]
MKYAPSFVAAALLALLSHPLAVAASTSDDGSKPHKPCTIRSPSTDRFFDLNSIRVALPAADESTSTSGGSSDSDDTKVESWHARGYDYGANFTLNFCGPVVESLEDVVGVDENRWRNVSAFYEKGGHTYSIGQQNSELVFRGRKLVLNYTDGSPCEAGGEERKRELAPTPLDPRELYGSDGNKSKGDGGEHGEDGYDRPEGDGYGKPKQLASGKRRKNTIISLLCEKDPLAPQAAVSFVGASPDECTYFFESRSGAACGGIEKEIQTLGPGGVFGVIVLVAVIVYLVGGCVYQRNVMHQRGWRQLPNYGFWAGIVFFLRDVVIILTSSCARLIPQRRGYSRVASSINGRGRGRGNHSDDENRLIDQLDEEWDD